MKRSKVNLHGKNVLPNDEQPTSLRGFVSPSHLLASRLGPEAVKMEKGKSTTMVDPVTLKRVVNDVIEVRNDLNAMIKLLSQTRFEKECDHTDSYIKSLADFKTRSKGLLEKIVKFKDESFRIQQNKFKKVTK
jgi:hypothetical protein